MFNFLTDLFNSNSNAGDNRTHYRVTYAGLLHDAAAKIRKQRIRKPRIEYSPEFYCHQDPESPMFRLEFDYGRARAGHLGVGFVITTHTTEKAIAHTRMTRMRLHDEEGKLLADTKVKAEDPGFIWNILSSMCLGYMLFFGAWLVLVVAFFGIVAFIGIVITANSYESFQEHFRESFEEWIESDSGDNDHGCSHFYKPKKGWFEGWFRGDTLEENNWKISVEIEYVKEGDDQQKVVHLGQRDAQNDPLLQLLESSTNAVVTESSTNADVTESSTNADVTFVVQGVNIQAHKNILSAGSKYFQRMFKENVTDEVEVADVEPEIFRILLRYLYSGSAPELEADKALRLLLAADKYGEEKLAKICENTAAASINVDNVVDTLLVADSVKNEKLMTRAKVVFQLHVDELLASDADAEKLKSRPALMLQLIAHCAKH